MIAHVCALVFYDVEGKVRKDSMLSAVWTRVAQDAACIDIAWNDIGSDEN